MTNEYITTLPKSKATFFILDLLQYFIKKNNKKRFKNLI